jgi:hypothetical protein
MLETRTAGEERNKSILLEMRNGTMGRGSRETNTQSARRREVLSWRKSSDRNGWWLYEARLFGGGSGLIDFTLDKDLERLRSRVRDFVDTVVIPREDELVHDLEKLEKLRSEL